LFFKEGADWRAMERCSDSWIKLETVLLPPVKPDQSSVENLSTIHNVRRERLPLKSTEFTEQQITSA